MSGGGGTPLRLGPFTGGLNLAADPTTVADVELVECINFEQAHDNSGTLLSRPPIQTTTDMSATWTERIRMLGTGIIGGVTSLFGGNADGTYRFSGGVWTQLSSTFNAVACIQYNNIIYFLNEAGGAGISRTLAQWDGTTFTILNPANLNTMLPGFGGGSLAIYKERLFIVPGKDATANGSRLVFSDAGAPQTYTTTTQFIDIRPGDGQNLVDLLVYTDNIVLFKEDSTHILSYTSSPNDAEVFPVNNLYGATRRNCVVTYENAIYMYHRGKIYVMGSNYDVQRVNIRVPFVYDATTPSARAEEAFICLFGDRLIVKYYNKTYVLGLRTNSWSEWASSSTDLHNFGPLVGIPSNVVSAQADEYYAGSAILSNEKVYLIKDGFNSTDREKADGVNYTISSSVVTKNYDLASSHTYKKLNWWGTDVVSANGIVGTATPLAYGFSTTWGALYNASVKWYDAATWASALTSNLVVTTTASPGSMSRIFVKFQKGLRYRQINFKVELESSGLTSDSPCKLFSITEFTGTKETVSKVIS